MNDTPTGGGNRQGDHAKKRDTKTSTLALLASDGASDPLEDGVGQRVRFFIEAILKEELEAALGRGRYERACSMAFSLPAICSGDQRK